MEAEIEKQNSEIITFEEPSDLKLRPIISGPECPTRSLSDITDKILKPLLMHVKSYIKDSTDFLNKCKRKLSSKTLLTTFDVCSLYTSIPHDLGIEAIEYFLDKYPNTIDKLFKKEFILEGLKFILKNNTFLFNGDNFLQLVGTAMGTIVAPTYATLVMAFLEIKLYNIVERQLGIEQRIFFEVNWARFLDDCYYPTNTEVLTPEELLDLLNSLNPHIQFTMETSANSISFLDILIMRDENDNIWMNIYHKPTDARRYVPFNSCHPKHTLSNIPYSLARRICTIIENEDAKDLELMDLANSLKRQGYPDSIIKKGIEKAKNSPQIELRKPKEKNERKLLPFVHTNNPNNPDIFKTIKTSIDLIKTSSKSANIFKSYDLINSTKQPRNLERLLCKTEYIVKEKIKIRKCGKNCCSCDYINETDSIEFKNKKDGPFIIKSPFNCDSSNFVYLILCSGCNEEYIGQTSRTLRERIVLYRQHIHDETKRTSYVEKHLFKCGKGKFKIYPFLQLRSNDLTKREGHESAFIAQLKPTLNRKE